MSVDTPMPGTPSVDKPRGKNGCYTATEVCDFAAITYRMLDYWSRNGFLAATQEAPGAGNRRTWAAREVQVAAYMGDLVRAGMSPPAAAPIAAALADTAQAVRLGPGVGWAVPRADIMALAALPDGAHVQHAMALGTPSMVFTPENSVVPDVVP